MENTIVATGTGEGYALKVDSTGKAHTRAYLPTESRTIFTTQVAVLVGGSLLVNARSGRAGFKIMNVGANILTIDLGLGANAGSWQLPPNATFEPPAGMVYDGDVTGFPLGGVNGAAVVIEFL